MTRKNIHTTYNSQTKQWRNVSEGAGRAIKNYGTKQQAQTDGRQLSKDRGVEHFIHNQDGKIGQRNSYGHDPRNIKG